MEARRDLVWSGGVDENELSDLVGAAKRPLDRG